MPPDLCASEPGILLPQPDRSHEPKPCNRDTPMIDGSAPTYCANHPGVETSLRCNKCGKPICARCAIRTPTGYRCKECVRGQQKIFETAEWYDYALGFAIGGIFLFPGQPAGWPDQRHCRYFRLVYHCFFRAYGWNGDCRSGAPCHTQTSLPATLHYGRRGSRAGRPSGHHFKSYFLQSIWSYLPSHFFIRCHTDHLHPPVWHSIDEMTC